MLNDSCGSAFSSYVQDDLSLEEWRLVVKLKNLFKIQWDSGLFVRTSPFPYGAPTMRPLWLKIGKWISFGPLTFEVKNPLWRGSKGRAQHHFVPQWWSPSVVQPTCVGSWALSSQFIFSFSIYSLWFREKYKVHIQWVPLCGAQVLRIIA